MLNFCLYKPCAMCLSLLHFQPCAGSEPDCNCCLSSKYTYMQLRSPEVTRVNFHLSSFDRQAVVNFDPSDQTAPHLNHGDLAGDQTVSDDHVAPLDVQPFLGHGGGDEQVDLYSVTLTAH